MKKITDADKARLKKLQAGKGAMANGKLSMDEQLEFNALKRKERQATAYSPRPMSAADKAKASAAGKAAAARTKPKSTAAKVAGLAGKVAGKAAGVAKAGAKALSKEPRSRGAVKVTKPSKPSTAYSPTPMSADAKRKMKQSAALRQSLKGMKIGVVNFDKLALDRAEKAKKK